jgi:hypothetical protein
MGLSPLPLSETPGVDPTITPTVTPTSVTLSDTQWTKRGSFLALL